VNPLATLVRGIGEVAQKGKPFYSPIDKAISEIVQTKGTGDQMLAQILKTKGVAKELKERPAIKAALQQPKITKAELEKVAAENPPPEVFEKVDRGPSEAKYRVEHDDVTDRYVVLDDYSDIVKSFRNYDDAESYAYKLGSGTAQYEKWQLPGGENYREIKLMLPLNKRLEFVDKRINELQPIINQQPIGITPERQEYSKLWEEKELLNKSSGYKSSHFDEPNVLAHARVSDRTGPNGEKILHVEEIQSDWHQTGRKKGYVDEKEKQFIKDKLARGEDLTKDEERARLRYLKADAVPDAPFKQNWHELVMKRLLDDAVKKGYDKVVITPGAEQAKRYSLSNAVDEINVVGRTHALTGEQTKQVALDTKDGRSLRLGVAADGTIDNVSDSAIEGFLGKKLDEVVGKDVAKNIMEGGTQTISGLNLQVGGEGMKGFYDQMLPAFLNDYGKKWGARVGQYEIYPYEIAEKRKELINNLIKQGNTPESAEKQALGIYPEKEPSILLHSFDITPQMREDIVGKGQPLYQAIPAGVGAGTLAAPQEESPSEYDRGGIVKNVIKSLLPKGQQAVLPAAESAANLDRFLSESKVPMRLYHGTTTTEGGKGEEAIRRIKPSKEGALGSGSYLTPKPSYSSGYAEGVGGNILPVHAQIKNPLIIEGNGDPMIEALIKLGMDENKAVKMVERAYENKGYIGKEVESRARSAGYDGLMQYRNGDLNEVVVYNPNAIKSAIGNRGTYDITEQDLNKAKGGSVNMDAMRMAVMNKQLRKRHG
jgi:hypothetical protein